MLGQVRELSMPDERYQRLEERVEYLTRQSSDLLGKCEASEGLLQSILQVMRALEHLFACTWLFRVEGIFPRQRVAALIRHIFAFKCLFSFVESSTLGPSAWDDF